MDPDNYPPEIAAGIRDAMERKRQLAEMIAQPEPLATAGLMTMGVHPVSVVTGSPETEEEAALVNDLPKIAAECDGERTPSAFGGNEYVTYLFDRPNAVHAAEAFASTVRLRAPRWWQVTATAHPVYHD